MISDWEQEQVDLVSEDIKLAIARLQNLQDSLDSGISPKMCLNLSDTIVSKVKQIDGRLSAINDRAY